MVNSHEGINRLPAALRQALIAWKHAEDNRCFEDLASFGCPLHHYTDIRALEGILRNQELWFTNARHLNDPTEIDYGLGAVLDALKAFSPVGEDSWTSFLANIIRADAETRSVEVYIASFSGEADDLAQWRAYGDNGQGVCITFEPQFFIEHAPCSYGAGVVVYGDGSARARSDKLVQGIMKKLPIEHFSVELLDVYLDLEYDGSKSDLFNPIWEKVIWNSLLMKHDAYHAEKELRIFLIDEPKTLQKHVQTRIKGNDIVPYIPQKLPLKEKGGITKLQLGPAAGRRVQDGLRHLLRQHDYDEAILAPQSTIPYRSLSR